MDWQLWKTALKEHYTAPMETTFKQFRLGAMLFFLGGVMIYIAINAIEPSVRQEALLLMGLVTGGLGFAVAMLAQVRMLISRILRFFQE